MDFQKFFGNSKKLDWFFICITFSLMLFGVLLVYSATKTNETANVFQAYWFKQIIYFSFGSIFAFGLSFVKLSILKKIALPFYLLTLILLVLVLFFAGDVKGAGRWIDFGVIKLQPSELAKISYLLMISSWLSKHPVDLLKLKTLIVPGILFFVPFLLVLKQPDLSTALVFTMITLVCFFFAKMKLSDVFFLVSPFFSVVLSHSQITYSQILWGAFVCFLAFILYKRKLPIAYTIVIFLINILAGYAGTMAWNHLEEHQQKRVETFFNPMADPKGDGYQVIQSMIAIGSGGIFGKGFQEGSQTNLSFLPEEHTDFIFSVLGEQFGFIGCIFILTLYFLFLCRAMSICKSCQSPFVILVTAASSSVFLFHIVVNIAMTIGLMPVTGLPLPFLSYGGSFAVICLCLVGLICNMRLHGNK